MESVSSLQYQDTGLIPGLAQWVKDLVSLQLWCSCGSDSIPGREHPYAVGMVEKKKKKHLIPFTNLVHWKNFLYFWENAF